MGSCFSRKTYVAEIKDGFTDIKSNDPTMKDQMYIGLVDAYTKRIKIIGSSKKIGKKTYRVEHF